MATSAAPETSSLRLASPQQDHRRKVPSVLQMEAVECGAAALAMVLEFYGKVVPLEELRMSCGVSRDGSKASNVLRAARTYGLEARGYKVELDDIRTVQLPAILFWNFNHFLVLEGYRKGTYYLNDPAEGPRTVTEKEFDEAYTGVVLSFRPGPEFRKSGERPSAFAALRQRLESSREALRFAVLAGLCLVVTGLVIPTFSQIFVDEVLVARLEQWFRPLIIAMALTAVLRASISALQQRFLTRLQVKLAVTSASRFIWHLLRLPVEFYSQRYSGEIATRVALNDTVATFVGKQLTGAAIDALVVLFYALLMLSYDWVLTSVGLVSVTIVTLTTARVNRYRRDGSKRLVHEEGKATGALIGGLNTIETLKASGAESDLFQKWAGHHAKSINAKQRLELTTQLFLAVPPFLTAVTNVLVLGIGAYRVMDGMLTIGMLVAFQSLMQSFLVPVNNLVNLAGNVQNMDGNIARIDDVLRYKPDASVVREEQENTEDALAADRARRTTGALAPALKLTGQLEFANVSFGYSRLAAPLLKGLTLKLTPGARIALVGPTGCGKSTIAKVVTGLYDAWDGDILLDGVPRHRVPRRVLTNSIAMVDQDISLFEGSVRENLTLWDPTVPDSVIVRACKDACIHDDIAARPGGYDSIVAEGGANFSGGQRQRLEIARALIANPRILVLDEATSALDSLTEQIIDENLRRRGCTCIIIAHRLSTVRDADEILVLERGKVVQRGTHDTLMADREGLYAELAAMVS